MKKFRHQIKDESGQAMIAVLLCLVLGALTITTTVAYAATGVHGVLLKQSSLLGQYSADSGIEDVLWSIKHGTQPNTSLPGNLTPGVQVAMDTINTGNYTMIAGSWVTTTSESHSADLHISSNMTWDAGENAYKFTVSATYTGPGNCKLIQIGAGLPVGYTYSDNSSASFPGNLSTANPDDEQQEDGSHVLTWNFPMTIINPTRTQIFYVTGSGEQTWHYGWAVATRDDVGTVGELSGNFYDITATASKDAAIIGKIEANAMLSAVGPVIISYRILD